MTAESRLPIVGLGRNDWTGTWMNRQQLLSRLGERGWPVVYSNGPRVIWERERAGWRQIPWLGRFVDRDHVRVDFPGRMLCGWPRYQAWDQFVLRRHVARLRKALGVAGNGFIALAFDPMFWPHVELLESRFVAYHAYDAFSLMPGWDDEQADFEAKLVARADLVTASTRGVVRELPGDGPDEARELMNGADVDRVSAAAHHPCPADLAAIPGPRIGYVGAINDKVDYDLVAGIARRRPDWNLVFIGPVLGAEDGHITVPQWAGLSNIHLLGPRSQAEAAVYSHNMDVNLICYGLADASWAKTGNPLKLYEYLAAGRPVVSCDLEMVRPFATAVSIATGVDEWVEAIERSMRDDDEDAVQGRRAMARENSWDRRVDQLESWLMEMIRVRTS